jgi:hypothetical protein
MDAATCCYWAPRRCLCASRHWRSTASIDCRYGGGGQARVLRVHGVRVVAEQSGAVRPHVRARERPVAVWEPACGRARVAGQPSQLPVLALWSCA